ncbi:unnamed protein product [Caenorhabditis auriculariae]|uniref:G protein-coupled receptor n=1 Tax=Caenorhabditis auriculariae TaxID=2777116 RepID=A0A8S1HX60_9PELO|nr:unnamed protein product [Caenorhabditis auriculariae]
MNVSEAVRLKVERHAGKVGRSSGPAPELVRKTFGHIKLVDQRINIRDIEAVLNAVLLKDSIRNSLLFGYTVSLTILLVNVATTDLILSAASGFVMTRIMTIGNNIAFVFHGFCGRFGSELCFQGHSFILHCLVHCVLLTVISFAYRLFVLRRPPPKPIFLWLSIIAIYIPSFVMFYTYLYALEKDPSIIEGLKKQRNNIDWENLAHGFTISVFTFTVAGCCNYLFLIATVGCFTVIIIRRKAHAILLTASQSLSPSTKRVHKTLMKALAMQASLPFLMYIADLIFTSIYLFGIKSSPMENSVFLITTLPPALSPIMYIYYVRPYRKGLLEWISKFTRILLLNVASTDLLCSAASGFVMTRIMTIDNHLGFIFPGPCRYFGEKICFWGHSFMLMVLAHCVVLTVISFAYRLFVLRHPPPSQRLLWLSIFLGFLPSFVMFYTYLYALESDPTVTNDLKNQRSDIIWDSYTHAFTITAFSPTVAGCCTYLGVLTTAAIATVLIIRRKAQKILTNASESLSPSTKQLHKTLMKALAVQASLPFLMYIADLMFTSIYLFEIKSSPVESSVFLITTFPPALSPILYIYYVRPYRKRPTGMDQKMYRIQESTTSNLCRRDGFELLKNLSCHRTLTGK